MSVVLHRFVRPLGVLAVTGPLAAALLVAAAPVALAAGTISSPAANAVISSGSSFTATATVTSGSADTTMTLDGPGNYSQAKSAPRNLTNDQTLSIAVSTGSGASVRNGSWTITLSGGATGTRTFTTNFTPATPGGFAASGSGARDVSFSWTKGSEPDLSGYSLTEDTGTVVDGNIDLSHCSGSSCSYALYYPSDNPGTHTYQLVAKRPGGGCSGCASTLTSGKTSANATLTAPPPKPSPTPSPTASPTPSATADPGTGTTGGGGSTASTSGDPSGTTSGTSSTGGTSAGGTSGTSTGGTSSTGGSSTTGSSGSTTGTTGTQAGPIPTLGASLSQQVLAARERFANQFNNFSSSLNIPKLPPLPALDLPTISGEGPLPAGTFQPVLPYTPPTETVAEPGGFAHPVAAVRNIIDSDRLAKSLAGALILLLMGAHLRRFIGAHIED